MSLNGGPWFVDYIEGGKLDAPLGNSACCVCVVDYVPQWCPADYCHCVLLEKVPMYYGGEEYAVSQLLVMWIPLLGGGEDFTDEVNRTLLRRRGFAFLSFHSQDNALLQLPRCRAALVPAI